MIVILNGALGVGKTQTAWALLEKFERGVMLDGDYIGAVQPFDLADPQRVTYLYATLAHLIDWHQQHGYANFVLNYVFESAAELAQLREMLLPYDPDIHAFRLTCDADEHQRRVQQRGNAPLAGELERAMQLREIQEAAAQHGDLGAVIDTTAKKVNAVADAIVAKLWKCEKIEIKEYDPYWPSAYQQEAQRIREALGPLAAEIHHIGSTSVPGLAAKPIVDIIVAVPTLALGAQLDERLYPLGYRTPDSPDELEHRFFLRGLPRRFHLHIYPQGSVEIGRHLSFRDALRASPQQRDHYATLKLQLSQQHRDDREAYTEAKSGFIQAVEAAIQPPTKN